MTDDEGPVRAAYAAYDAQDLDRLLALVTDDVDWPTARPDCTENEL